MIVKLDFTELRFSRTKDNLPLNIHVKNKKMHIKDIQNADYVAFRKNKLT